MLQPLERLLGRTQQLGLNLSVPRTLDAGTREQAILTYQNPLPVPVGGVQSELFLGNSRVATFTPSNILPFPLTTSVFAFFQVPGQPGARMNLTMVTSWVDATITTNFGTVLIAQPLAVRVAQQVSVLQQETSDLESEVQELQRIDANTSGRLAQLSAQQAEAQQGILNLQEDTAAAQQSILALQGENVDRSQEIFGLQQQIGDNQAQVAALRQEDLLLRQEIGGLQQGQAANRQRILVLEGGQATMGLEIASLQILAQQLPSLRQQMGNLEARLRGVESTALTAVDLAPLEQGVATLVGEVSALRVQTQPIPALVEQQQAQGAQLGVLGALVNNINEQVFGIQERQDVQQAELQSLELQQQAQGAQFGFLGALVNNINEQVFGIQERQDVQQAELQSLELQQQAQGAQFGFLGALVNNINEQVFGVQERQDVQQAQLGSLQEQLALQDAEIAALNTLSSGTNARVLSLEQGQQEVRTSTTANTVQVGSLSTQVQQLNAAVAPVPALVSNVAAQQTQLTQAANLAQSTSNRITSLEAALGALGGLPRDGEARLQALEGEVGGLRADISALEAALDVIIRQPVPAPLPAPAPTPSPQPPRLTISPAGSLTVQRNDAVTFTALTSPASGVQLFALFASDLSSQVRWSLDGSFIGSGAERTITFRDLGSHRVEASVTDPATGLSAAIGTLVQVQGAAPGEPPAPPAPRFDVGDRVRPVVDPTNVGAGTILIATLFDPIIKEWRYTVNWDSLGLRVNILESNLEILGPTPPPEVTISPSGEINATFLESMSFTAQAVAGNGADISGSVEWWVVGPADLRNEAQFLGEGRAIDIFFNRLGTNEVFARVRVLGLNDIATGQIGESASAFVNVQPPPPTEPTLRILQPAEGSTWQRGEPITIRGVAEANPSGQDLSPDIQWLAVIPGDEVVTLGIGSIITPRIEAVGLVTIQAAVADTFSLPGTPLTAVAQRQIRLEPPPPPWPDAFEHPAMGGFWGFMMLTREQVIFLNQNGVDLSAMILGEAASRGIRGEAIDAAQHRDPSNSQNDLFLWFSTDHPVPT